VLQEEKREMVNILTPNRLADGKRLYMKPSISIPPDCTSACGFEGDPKRATPRMLDSIIEDLLKLNTVGQLPDLSACSGFTRQGEEDVREAG